MSIGLNLWGVGELTEFLKLSSMDSRFKNPYTIGFHYYFEKQLYYDFL